LSNFCKILTAPRRSPCQISVKKYQTLGENRAAAAGPGANPTANLWFARESWDCLADKCHSQIQPDCRPYKQLIWESTSYIGCGKCHCVGNNPYHDEGEDWDYLVCDFNEAGNFGTDHPFGVNPTKKEICAGNYTVPPPPQPHCSTCHNTSLCKIPTNVAALSVCVDGVWHIHGPVVNISDLAEIQCPVVVDGDLHGTQADTLHLNNCGRVTVHGTTVFTGNPGVEYDLRGVIGSMPRTWYTIMSFGVPVTASSVFRKPIVKNVWTPTVELCSTAVTGSNNAYIYLFDCAIANPTLSVPDFRAHSPFAQVHNFDLAADGDINDPDFTGAKPVPAGPGPKGPNSSPHSGPGAVTPGHKKLPSWAIFLIVLAVLILVALLICAIVFIFVKKSPTETV